MSRKPTAKTTTASNSTTVFTDVDAAKDWLAGPPEPDTLRDRVAGVMERLCEITGHARGCWLLNSSPARRLWWWALALPPVVRSND